MAENIKWKNDKVECDGKQTIENGNFDLSGSCKILKPKKGKFTFRVSGKVE